MLKNLVYLIFGLLVWFGVLSLFNWNPSSTDISQILGDVISAFVTGYLSYTIYRRYVKVTALYNLSKKEINSSTENTNREFRRINSQLVFDHSASGLVYSFPFVLFFLIFALDTQLLLGRIYFLSAAIVGVWVAVGFSSSFISKLALSKTGDEFE